MSWLFCRPFTPIEFICVKDHVAPHHDQLVHRLSRHASAPPAECRGRVGCPMARPLAAAWHRIEIGKTPCRTHMLRHALIAGSLTVITLSSATRPRASTGLAVRLLEHGRLLLLPYRRWLRLDAAMPETVVAYHGARGDPADPHALLSADLRQGRARSGAPTALQRLDKYLAGHNRSGARLRAVGPIVQREEAPGRWLVSVDLPGVEEAFMAAVSGNGRVRIRPVQIEFLAVLRMSGRPAPEAIAGGGAAISAALAGTMWLPAGGPMARLHRPPTILPFANRFEVALPIARVRYDAPSQREACGDAGRH
jgi:SOUL heme-binding protein